MLVSSSEGIKKSSLANNVLTTHICLPLLYGQLFLRGQLAHLPMQIITVRLKVYEKCDGLPLWTVPKMTEYMKLLFTLLNFDELELMRLNRAEIISVVQLLKCSGCRLLLSLSEKRPCL